MCPPPLCRKYDSKVTPKSPSHAKSGAEVTPEWLQSHLHTLKVIPKPTKPFKFSFTFFPIIRKSGSLEAPKPRSLEVPRRESRSEINLGVSLSSNAECGLGFPTGEPAVYRSAGSVIRKAKSQRPNARNKSRESQIRANIAVNI